MNCSSLCNPKSMEFCPRDYLQETSDIAFRQRTLDASTVIPSPKLDNIPHETNASEPQQISSFPRKLPAIPRFAAQAKNLADPPPTATARPMFFLGFSQPAVSSDSIAPPDPRRNSRPHTVPLH